MPFTEKTVQLEQVSAGIYKTLTALTYTTKKGEIINVPIGYITDGYSKPRLTEILVGGRFEDDIRPSCIHDFLCENKGYYNSEGVFVPLSFNKVNNIFYEAMDEKDVKISWLKAVVMRIAVEFNPNRW